MPSEKDNTLEFTLYMKSDKMSFDIYAKIESVIKKKQIDFKKSRKFFNNKNR